MLTSRKLTRRSHRPERLPPDLGRAARAVLLKLIAAEDPQLVEQLHAPNQRRPYTCSTMWGAQTRDGSLIWRAELAGPQEMMPWIRGWGADVEVLAPQRLRRHMASEARRVVDKWR